MKVLNFYPLPDLVLNFYQLLSQVSLSVQAPAAPAAKLRQEVKKLQGHADIALHLAMEYRTAMEVLLPEAGTWPATWIHPAMTKELTAEHWNHWNILLMLVPNN